MPDAPQEFSSAARLAAKVAHELNNPLDAVLRFISLAQHKAKAGQYGDIDRHLSDAQFGLQRMAEILRELMDIGRETNQVLTGPRRLPLRELMERAAGGHLGIGGEKASPLDPRLPGGPA